jgi:hypothetical protein
MGQLLAAPAGFTGGNGKIYALSRILFLALKLKH